MDGKISDSAGQSRSQRHSPKQARRHRRAKVEARWPMVRCQDPPRQKPLVPRRDRVSNVNSTATPDAGECQGRGRRDRTKGLQVAEKGNLTLRSVGAAVRRLVRTSGTSFESSSQTLHTRTHGLVWYTEFASIWRLIWPKRVVADMRILKRGSLRRGAEAPNVECRRCRVDLDCRLLTRW